ncbi:MAG: aminoacyl-tRNA hydrolase [Bacteroidetes bacterium]|nr:aminoacyl-tRNA hydrolase [Bacteroidota bacterium]
MKIDIGPEMYFRFSRSGGKGGQHVNKVETRVEGYWNPAQSTLLTQEQRQRLLQKMAQYQNAEGALIVRAQSFRTQLENRLEAIRKMNSWIAQALHRKKARIATQPSAASKRRRMEEKHRLASKKSMRRSNNGREEES